MTQNGVITTRGRTPTSQDKLGMKCLTRTRKLYFTNYGVDWSPQQTQTPLSSYLDKNHAKHEGVESRDKSHKSSRMLQTNCCKSFCTLQGHNVNKIGVAPLNPQI